MTARRVVGSAIATIVALIAPIMVWVADTVWGDRVPDPLPIHWNFAGRVDNTMPVSLMVTGSLIFASLLALGAVAAIWLWHVSFAARFGASILTFGAYLVAGISVLTLVVSVDAANAHQVMLPIFTVLVLLLVTAMAAVGVWLLLPAVRPAQSDHPVASPLHFAPDEPVRWADAIHSRPLRFTAVVLAVGAVAAFVFAPRDVAILMALIALFGSVVVVLFSEVAVIIDSNGMHTRFGPFGWPRLKVPLGDIVSAATIDVLPKQWGGWGYRVSSRGTAVVLRSGPGLVLRRREKAAFAVTLDSAAEAADVVNALIARQRPSNGRKKRRR